MSEKIYNWKRFWCSRTSQVNLGDRGYLYDPESEYGHLFNPELVGLEAIADIPCLILLGEPGIGKSQEMKNLLKYTGETIKPPHRILERNLRSCDNLATYLIQHQDFIDWMNGEHRLYLFLDSLDEGMLTLKPLATQLFDEFSNDKYIDKLYRLYLRIACRTAVLPGFLEKGLQELWAENSAIYELAPLRQVDVKNAATEENVESQDFLSEVRDKALVSIAIKPFTLRSLLNIYKCNGNQFPSNQTLCSLYLEGCRLLCAETNPSRRGANQIGKLEPNQRLIVAARIAAITVFANRFAIWTESNQGDVPAEDVLIEQIALGKESYNNRTTDVTESAIREVLDTGLFSSRGLNRMGWAHKTYAEFLAAWYLTQHNVVTPKVLNLIIYPSGKVVPQLEETTAWLASMMPEVFQEVVKTAPDVLIQSDVAMTDYESKSKIVESLLTLHNEDKLEVFRFWKYGNLCHPGLAKQLEAYIIDSTKSQSSRYVAINIAIKCKQKAIQNSLVKVALDVTQLYEIRKRSAYAVCQIGDENTKAQLKPLALDDIRDNPDDDLKAYGFKAIWPHHITVSDLLFHLLLPTTTGVGGSTYQDFIAIEFTKHLKLSDLPIALNCLEKWRNRHCLHYPFKNLADSVMLKAWQNLDDPDVLKAFAGIAVIKLKRYEGVLGDRPSSGWHRMGSERNHDAEIEPLLKDSDDKRRKIIETIVLLITEPERNLSWLMGIVCSKDILWIIEKAKLSESDEVANIWAEILQRSLWLKYHNLRWKNTNHIDAILEACNASLVIKNKFKYEITPVELNSEIANQAKADYLRYKNDLKRPEPTPLTTSEQKQKIISVLEEVESKCPDLWWQMPREMTLTLNSNDYNNNYKFILDIAKFPGWIEANADIHSRVVETAKIYLFSEGIDTQIYTKSNLSDAHFAGSQALYLLFQKDLEFVSTILPEVWKKWMPIIFKSIVFSDERGNEICQKIVKAAYNAAPISFVETLVNLIIDNRLNTSYGHHIYEVIGKILDKYIASSVFDKIQNKYMDAELLSNLLSDLFDNEIEKAREIALSFLTRVKEVREKRIIAARMLTIYADDSSWSTLWPIIQQDCTFGCEVFESIASEPGYRITMEQNLNEDHLANLYIFLVQQFPESEEVKSQDKQGATVKRMESIDGIKIWRSNILQRLQSIGSVKASEALRKMIVELPEQKGDLQQKLLAIESSICRTTWKQPTPEEILQLIVNKEPSNLELDGKLNSINRGIQQMADEPKIDNSIHIKDSNISGGVNTGSIDTAKASHPEKRLDLKFWIPIIVTIVMGIFAILASGVFNEEIRKFFLDRNAPSKVEQKIEKQKSTSPSQATKSATP
jgi:predicted NACHT family NTPase